MTCFHHITLGNTFYFFQGELKLFVNGVCHGTAADNLPDRVFAVINLYGRCAQVSIVSNEPECTYLQIHRQ